MVLSGRKLNQFDPYRFSGKYVVSKHEYRIVDTTDGGRQIMLFYAGATTSDSDECGGGLIEVTESDKFESDSQHIRNYGLQGFVERYRPVLTVSGNCGDRLGLKSDSTSAVIPMATLMGSDFVIPKPSDRPSGWALL